MKKTTIITLSVAFVLALGILVFGPAASTFAQFEDPTTQGQPIQTNNSVNLQDTASAIYSANWADHVTLSANGDTITISSNGVPNHELGTYIRPGGEATVDAYNLSISIPTTPVYSAQPTQTSGGATGIAISGAAIYNPYDAGGEFAIGSVGDIDPCNGHPSPQGHYHYHGVPYCITDTLDTNGEHSVLIGYMLDGFPIYGPQDANGEVPTDLDECNGHFGSTPEYPEGIYHYHTTETAPFIPECYHGEVDGNSAGGFGGGQTQQTAAEQQPTAGNEQPQEPQFGEQQRPPRRQRP